MDIVMLIEGVHEDKEEPSRPELDKSIHPICSSVTLVKDELTLLVDSGNRGYELDLVSQLREQGLSPADIDIVFNTHSHFDHCSNNYLFMNAKIIHGNGIWTSKKMEVYNTLSIPIPGVTIIKTPGHEQDHQSIVVETDQSFVIAGDAIREDHIRNEGKWHSQNDAYKQSVKKIFDIADVIIPGHGRIIGGDLLIELQSIMNTNM